MRKLPYVIAALAATSLLVGAARATNFDFFGVVSAAYSPSDTSLLNKLPVNTSGSGILNTFNLNTGVTAGALGNGGAPVSALIGTTTTVFAGPAPRVYEIDFYGLISNLPANTGFDAVAFDTVYSSALTIPTSPNPDYLPDKSKFNGTKSYWAVNGDAGPNGDDLQAVVAADQNFGGGVFAPGDPRATLAQGSAAYIGSIYLLWNTTAAATINIANLQYTTLDETTGQGGPTVFVSDPYQIVIQAAPEPASLGIVVIASPMLLRRRRASETTSSR